MRNVLVIARREYGTNIRRTGFLVVTALVPLTVIIALGVMMFFSGSASQLLEKAFGSTPGEVGVVDHSSIFTPILAEFQDQFRPYPDETAGRKALLAGDVSALLVVPSAYLSNGKVQLLVLQGSGLQSGMLTDSPRMDAFLVSHLLRNENPALRQRAAHPAHFSTVQVSSKGESENRGPLGEVYAFLVPYFFSILLVITIFTSAGYLLQGIAEEKENRIVEIILSSVSARELLAGKIVGLGAVGLTQVLIWVLSVLVFSSGSVFLMAVQLSLPGMLRMVLLALVYYLLGFTMYAVIMATTGSVGSNLKESQQISGIFSFFAAIPYMVAGFAFSNPNGLGLRLLSYFPLTAPTMMMMRLPMGSVPGIDIVLSILSIVVTIPVALWIGARIFRVGILMYGKRPSLRTLWQVWRQAG